MARFGSVQNFFKTSKISIIIPTLNESKNIQNTLGCAQTGKNVEVIVVDGGSEDETVNIAHSLGAKVIVGASSRAGQMNLGARAASGDILLFLHADTLLPPGFDDMIRTAMGEPGIVAGAFRLRIDAPLWQLRWVELGVNSRSQFCQMPYGDQAIFLTSSLFDIIGGFRDLPIMEDFELIRQVKSVGKIKILSISVITSARRWLKKGVLYTTLCNQIVIISYLLGISPQRIRKWYSR